MLFHTLLFGLLLHSILWYALRLPVFNATAPSLFFVRASAAKVGRSGLWRLWSTDCLSNQHLVTFHPFCTSCVYASLANTTYCLRSQVGWSGLWSGQSSDWKDLIRRKGTETKARGVRAKVRAQWPPDLFLVVMRLLPLWGKQWRVGINDQCKWLIEISLHYLQIFIITYNRKLAVWCVTGQRFKLWEGNTLCWRGIKNNLEVSVGSKKVQASYLVVYGEGELLQTTGTECMHGNLFINVTRGL